MARQAITMVAHGLLAMVPFTTASPAMPLAARSAEHPVHERRSDSAQATWTKISRLPPSDLLPMQIGLSQQNLHQGYDLLMSVSDPSSATYGQHWTPEEVQRTFAPSEDTMSQVKDWLVSAGIEKDSVMTDLSRGWLSFNATVDEVEELLGTEYWLYESTEDGLMSAGCDEYRISESLREHIDFVHPGVMTADVVVDEATARKLKARAKRDQRPTVSPRTKRQDVPTSCAELVTPECIASLYQVPAPTLTPNPNNTIGLYQFASWYQNDDLDLFFETYFPTIPQGTRPNNLSVDNDEWFYDTNDAAYFPGEADLDIDVAWPLIYPQGVTVYQVEDQYYTQFSVAYLGLFNNFLNAIDGSYCTYSAFGETGNNPTYDPEYPDNHTAISPGHPDPYEPGNYKGETMCGVYKPTNVISMSYSRPESTYTENYQKRQCNEFMKLGLQGVSIVVSSGDSGPLQSLSCSPSGRSYGVTCPSGCPYVTSVGATEYTEEGIEIGALGSNWATSGGFSSIYPRPDYQQAALEEYLANNDPAVAANFNTSNRAIPDVSGLGKNIAVVELGEVTTDAGSSASTPLFAALLNRINEERLAVGKSTVGFVNPVLYANPNMFTDVAAGNNSMCGLEGFYAVEGYDPVGGLGTPVFPKLLETFMALP